MSVNVCQALLNHVFPVDNNCRHGRNNHDMINSVINSRKPKVIIIIYHHFHHHDHHHYHWTEPSSKVKRVQIYQLDYIHCRCHRLRDRQRHPNNGHHFKNLVLKWGGFKSASWMSGSGGDNRAWAA